MAKHKPGDDFKKVLKIIIVLLIGLGLVAAYIPLLFTPSSVGY